MKRTTISRILCCSFFLLITSSLFGQSVLDSLRFQHRMLSMKKKSLILDYLQLTEAEKSSFWPIYDSYADVMEHVEMECLYLVFNYTRDNADPLIINSAPHKEDLSAQLEDINIRMSKIRKHYNKKFRKALSEEKAKAFMQLDLAFLSDILSVIPENAKSFERASLF
jgi:hypothetical protein